MELKTQKRVVDLAIAAGRKRLSPRTGFVHLFAADETASDTIPLYENFCFALALFRHRSVEAVLEGKELIERLLAFQGPEGNFPIYLHDFPRCHDPWMALKIAPVLFQIQRHFGHVISAETKGKIGSALERAIRFSQPRVRPPLWEHRFQRLICKEASFSPATPEEWFHWIATEQLGSEPIQAEMPYHPHLQAFIGGTESQEKGEPRPSPIEWALAEANGFSERLLKDSPAVIRSALLFPIEEPKVLPPEPVYWGEGRILWKGSSKLHSFSVPQGTWFGPNRVVFDLPAHAEPEKGDLIEAAAFCDLSPETQISIDGIKGTVFKLQEIVRIDTPALKLSLLFTLLEGEGEFSGQISRANRPAQTACRGPLLYEAFDWRISLRTLRRKGPCRIELTIYRS